MINLGSKKYTTNLGGGGRLKRRISFQANTEQRKAEGKWDYAKEEEEGEEEEEKKKKKKVMKKKRKKKKKKKKVMKKELYVLY